VQHSKLAAGLSEMGQLHALPRCSIAVRFTPGKYPPAEPGALVLEPLKAAYPCRSSQASLHSVNASPSAVPPQLGKL
jgi:hypothetical protein